MTGVLVKRFLDKCDCSCSDKLEESFMLHIESDKESNKYLVKSNLQIIENETLINNINKIIDNRTKGTLC